MRLTEDQSNDVTVTLPSAIDGLVTVGHKPGPGRNWPCMAATSGCRSSGGNRAAHRRTVRAFGSGATSRNSMEGLKSTRGKPGSSNVERPTDHSPPSPRSISRALRRRHPAHVRRQWQGTHRTSWLRTILTLRPAASGRTASTTRRGRQGLGSSERAGRRGGGGGDAALDSRDTRIEGVGDGVLPPLPDRFEKKPSTTSIQDADVGVKWKDRFG